jgi:serine O-acetyltransferase
MHSTIETFESVVQPVSPGTRAALKADTYRQLGRFSWAGLSKLFLKQRTFRPVITMRLCQGSRSGAFRLLHFPCRLLHRWATAKACMDFPWNARIGAGLAINHGFATVITAGAQIGRNVTLFHGVTIGRGDRIARDGTRTIAYPVIEDEVCVGPHSTIVGGVRVGRGSRILAGALVSEDIPPYSTVSGNPMTILKSNCMPDVMNPAPPES